MDEYTNQNQEPESGLNPQEQQTPGENENRQPLNQGEPEWQNGQNSQNPQNSGWQNGQSPQNPQNFGWQNRQNPQNFGWQNNQYQQPQPKQSNGMALASMIVGIFALLTCCIPFIQFPLAVIDIVLVILSKKGKPFHGFAVAGLVLGIISILISIGMTIYWGTVITMMKDPEFMSMYNEILKMYQ